MKIYGVTLIDDSDDCETRSETGLFTTKEEQLEWAYERYTYEYQWDIDNDRLDDSISDTKVPDKKDFFLRMERCGYDYYSRLDSSYQVEIFEQEI